MIVPNSKFVNENIVNWSHVEELTRFSVDVGVAYGSDVKLVEKLLLKSVEQNSAVALHPTPFVRFEDFGESSLDFRLFFWVKDTIQAENVKSDLRFAIDELFRTNAIQIPFPQRDVHIKTKD